MASEVGVEVVLVKMEQQQPVVPVDGLLAGVETQAVLQGLLRDKSLVVQLVAVPEASLSE
eukprot:CAMPEP_0181182104 /NCGR_PEP_ID=MMETSP1096-20121128/7709_1 /TAXON_ID=156174 ORGANISM="Chrysochromulina ericina, Strain CCMP281" /NCGR_SAMPLE_ID=MMETSP1096 /ASSEMBLY_ACC=CAM_ASM_000453 /LENGTH=59 /DNA_ID=CAMNT_0023270685 /DNA_START=397 /DNA_END=576 /DNA_ORIENTATION=-